jgi:lipopolysaccharide export system protein LptC
MKLPLSSDCVKGLRLPLVVLCLGGTLLYSQNAARKGGANAFANTVPEGFVNRQVVIPSFDEQGRKTSELKAATLTRIDDERLRAEDVIIEILAENPVENMKVQLKSATHHLTEQVLRSGERSVVTRADFQTSGDAMVYDSSSSKGSLIGNVRTLIFDTNAVSGKSKAAQPPKK